MKETEKKGNKKGKTVSVHETKSCRGRRGIVEPLLNLNRDEWSNYQRSRFTSKNK